MAFIERWPALSEATRQALAHLAGVTLRDDRGERDLAAQRALKFLERFTRLDGSAQRTLFKLAKSLPTSKATRPEGRKGGRGVALPVPTPQPAESAGESQGPVNRLSSMEGEQHEQSTNVGSRAAEVVPSQN